MSASTIPEDTSRRPGDGGGGGMMTRRSSQPAQPPPQPQPQQFGRGGVYPASARLTFIPGGISYSTHAATIGSGNENATATDAAMKVRIATEQPATLIQQARRADDALRLHSLWTAAAGSFGISSESLEPVPTAATATTTTKEEEPDKQTKQQQQVIDATPHFLPSLSVLAEAVLGRLTGCPADQAKGWADAMVLSQYHYEENHTAATGTGTGTTEDCQPQQQKERIPLSEDDLLQQQSELLSNRPASNKNESSQPPKSGRVGGDASVVALLKRLLLESERQAAKGQSGGGTADGGGGTGFRPVQRRPCGYVFKRGDIAWNCRTCQTDQTCVICDECFRGSNHDGHEVYFHRTTPGGCCDCGDAEAWHVEGCCNVHRPSEPTTTTTAATHQALLQPAVPSSSTSNNNNNCSSGETMMTNDDAPSLELTMDDPMEAVHAAATARQWAVETMTTDPVTRLPPRLLSALGVVMGAAVQCVMDTVDGAGVGADAIQWTKRWSDEAAAIVNAAPHNEDYWDYYGNQQPYNSSSPTMIVESTTLPPATLQTYAISNKIFPENYRLHLRLHNDDVHTFEEVIEALHEPRQMRPDVVPLSGDTEQQPHQLFPSLVSLRENATEMTHRVDADGQVTVKTYSNVASAMRGFRRLKSCGLHCAVVSTAQVDAEHRARAICVWLTEIAAAHPAAQALLVHALVQLPGRNNPSDDDDLGGIYTWHPARMIAPWASLAVTSDNIPMKLRQRFDTFPPHLASSYVTREEAELLHGMALAELQSIPTAIDNFVQVSGTVPDFYSLVPYRLPSKRYHKSPHALWGTLPSEYSDPLPTQCKHPLLDRLLSGTTQPHPAVMNRLTESVYVVDTDLRKQQVGERVTSSVFPHKLHGMNMISGVGMTHVKEIDARRPPLPSPMDLRHLLATSSFRAPLSPLLLLMLLDPYPTKQLRGAIHALFLSLLTNGRFKSRFAGAMAIAYRPLSTLFCTGVGTEADTPLHFTVQIFTAGSLVRALGHGPSTELLLLSDQSATASLDERSQTSIGVFVPPIAHVIVRCIHTNLLGATKEVNMILKNTVSANDDNSQDDGLHVGSIALLPSLTYVAGEHPSMTPLPAAPDDGFLDSRSTRHKRLPHLLRDLDYVIETPGTALRLLLPSRFPVYQGPSFSSRGEDVLTFSCVFARMLRLAQGMDPQKRKISGGHVEYEQNRWLEAFGLSLNFGGTRDALAECPCGAASAAILAGTGMGDDSHMQLLREAVGNIIASLLREIKLWLYREGLLETGLPIPSGGANSAMDLAQVEALQRSTLHVSTSYLGNESSSMSDLLQNSSNSVALSCATGVKMTEAQLTLIENALKLEAAQRLEQQSLFFTGDVLKQLPSAGPVIGDWLRVPHAPLAGDSLSFHLPLHRALAKCVKCICSVVIPEQVVASNPDGWWKIPVLDDTQSSGSYSDLKCLPRNPLVPLIRTTLRSSNCRVVWSAGPDCTPQEAQRRRSRSRSVSASIAVAKVIHSLADHPIRCLAAAQQIERHLWARNGTSVAGMAMNYLSAPLCRTFRDLDLLLVQLSASGMSCGLGARRIFSLLLSRFSLDGYLCDPERRSQASHMSTNSFSSTMSMWVNPPRLQDADHAVILAESFFTTLCILVTELPLLPPNSLTDDIPLRSSIRRELLHALAAEPRSHSEAMTAAAVGISRREENEGTVGKGGSGGLFRAAFSAVLREIGKQKLQSSSRASSSPPAFELKAEYCDEYDPTFFHLRRPEHQHAMDIVARLRKQKLGNNREALDVCLPIVCAPPKAHPRFLPCRLLLHLDCMDASLRRALLFALTNGSWIPPPEPLLKSDSGDEEGADSTGTSKVTKITRSSSLLAGSDVPPTTTFNRRLYKAQSSSGSFSKRSGTYDRALFNSDVVATSSVSFLEVLQLLTLQVHTLEECASLHRLCPDLDDEGRLLSSSLSINSYLSRLVFVPESLVDVWALRPHPHGPLKSRGSGDNRGSILGLLIALYEHRADHGASTDDDSGENGQGVDDHGGARSLASSGLKWLLRFINALVDGASSVGAAVKSAKMGIPLRVASVSDSGSVSWTIGEHLRSNILEMLDNLPDLWPTQKTEPFSPEKGNAKNKEARKAAQQRVMEMMKLKQAAFAATISSDTVVKGSNDDPVTEVDLCIICRCDDTDGDNNGPLGYLGHVQRSRMLQMRSMGESFERDKGKQALVNSYRVVGHMGCQVGLFYVVCVVGLAL